MTFLRPWPSALTYVSASPFPFLSFLFLGADEVGANSFVILRNSAAHTVVIKGVQTFQNNMSVEYSDLDVMQMLGRAVIILFYYYY